MIRESAFAKINLFLEITGKRPDGYHDLVTVMQTVTLADTLTFERSEAPGVRLTAGGIGTGEDNLVCRAAKAFFNAAGAAFGVDITLEKNIPIAAGLGGGSADAAATLRALNRLSEKKLPLAALSAAALSVGADVPFLLSGGLAACRGVGEQMTPVSHTVPGVIVIAIGKDGMSTPAAFAEADRLYGNFQSPVLHPAAHEPERVFGAEILTAEAVFNRFESAVFPLRPEAACLKRRLHDLGAHTAQMSGSGPSVFGIFDDPALAGAAAEKLKTDGVRAFLCRATDRIVIEGEEL